jgi:hypothetical protein
MSIRKIPLKEHKYLGRPAGADEDTEDPDVQTYLEKTRNFLSTDRALHDFVSAISCKKWFCVSLHN